MNKSISINIDNAESLFQIYQDHYPNVKICKFKLNKSLSVDENLNNLALVALDATATLSVYYSYKPIFLDMISRWIVYSEEFETKLKENNANNSNINTGSSTSKSKTLVTSIKGSLILIALSRLILISPESLTLIERFVTDCNIFNDLSKSLNSSNIHEIEGILLAYNRLIKFDCHRFQSFIIPHVLYDILKLEDPEFNVAKYLATQILSSYLNASEASTKKMQEIHIKEKEGSLVSFYEYETTDYRFLSLIEAKRISNFKSLPEISNDIKSSNKFIVAEESDLSPLVTSICGVLVPNLLAKTKESAISHFVPTDNAIKVLRELAHHIQNDKSVMLYGKAGAGKTYLINQLAQYMSYQDSIVKIHLGEQTDAKLLLGAFTSGEKPGTFEWKSGVLTTAVKEGKWVLIEDIDKAPTEVLSVLLTLLEKRELTIPSRGEVIKAKNGFQVFSTIRIANDSSKITIPDLIGLRLWELVKVEVPNEVELKSILMTKFPLLKNLIIPFIKCYNEILKIYSLSSFISLNRGSHPRVISFRDLMKFCSRCYSMLVQEGINDTEQLLESYIYDNIFAEAADCFGSAITEQAALTPLINAIGETLEIPTSRINLFLSKHVPNFINDDDKIKIGRATLIKSESDRALYSNKTSGNNTSFAKTNHSLRLMEQIGVSIQMTEPVLLVGETGTGKTTVVQQVAKMMNKKITVINVSQQTEAGDLLGGYKPVNTKTIAVPIQDTFESLFLVTFSKKKNERFSQILSKCFNKNQWKNVVKLWNEAFRMAQDLLSKVESDSDEAPKKKRKLSSHDKTILLDKWVEFQNKVKEFEIHSSSLENSFVFNFVEGSLVKAVRNGEWLLLDEINLASSDTLENVADLLSESINQRSILLTERGDIESIKAHPDFRIFGCMNPSTDVGKKDLPLSIRSRFSEIYVHSPDRDILDLLMIIDKYINRYAIGDEWVGNDIAELYLEAKKLSESNKIVDGANQRPHFSIRTLTRTLIYVCDIVSIYGLRRSLYEGFCMAFLTLLDTKSEEMLKPIIVKHTIGRLKNAKSVMSQIPPAPQSRDREFVQFRHYWMKHGPNEIIPQPHYIITPFVEKNMLNLVRATAGRRFPVLVQGPTSVGKTSMINYLANITGHKFVRINNHEHTDLQEYLGTYVSDSSGKLTFKEGVLVEALRKGHWIVLDELNLAPTDVLEALNRLLDDNRELFIPETQEVVHPHPDFMIFATQNPPGLYGGRKVLSRAFRNRFLELHFDDIPQDELEIILKERCQIAPSYGKKIVEVYRQLSIQRQSSRLFEQKNSFATLRDLFRWAMREAVGYEELAANGYMLLAERVRKEDEKLVVKQTLEKVMKVKLDMDAHYKKLENEALMNTSSSIVWTKAMRRLAVLVFTSIKYQEPLLLVGETGCGKTTICQIIAEYLGKELITVNAHQNTETGDILGAQRPVRNKLEAQRQLCQNLLTLFHAMNIETPEDTSLEGLLKIFNSIESFEGVDQSILDAVSESKRSSNVLFEWNDGPLVQAMKTGNFFLLDEISLADDSVLERLNSVLEPERSLLLAEKGTDDAFVTGTEGFEFLATMNPGGDYGKKELSPALRNRFTEIWVPSMGDFNDVREIVGSKLANEVQVEAIVKFSEWYGNKFGGGRADSGVISLRDILAWVEFINSCSADVEPMAALLHGAAMVFIDALGTNNTAYLAESEVRLREQKLLCVEKLSQITNQDLLQVFNERFVVSIQETEVTCGHFSVARTSTEEASENFTLHAPTTAANAMRVVRAMQVHKPILLEGSPGVGKTSLVSALANATSNPLIRINLSEQTDLIDLFGSDAPAEGGNTGEFVWRDAPFLRAMQRGEWVLLDEMNLASQSVLEGLNACLDHRGVAYIPELDKSFTRHPNFKVFAAQNPQYQGGGRKGLPKSFVNRFSVVYVDTLKTDDLNLISNHLYPDINPETTSKVIEFISRLEDEVVTHKKWGSAGGPWEFNLRDTLRWLALYNAGSIADDLSVSDFFDMIICQRFRTQGDKEKAANLFNTVFGASTARDNFYSITESYLQVGSSIIKRNSNIQYVTSSKLVPLECNFGILETAIRCINHNLPFILTGPSNSGKTELVRFIANIVGAKIDEFAMNSDVDSMDILGGYEQVDFTRAIGKLVGKVHDELNQLVVVNLRAKETNAATLGHAMKLIRYINNEEISLNKFSEFHQFLKSYLSFYTNESLERLLIDSATLEEKINQEKTVKFEWFDGLLVQAVEKGNWLVLDNANLCSPSVLDRLNSLLETNGSLVINECSSEDGQPRTLKPHPNFRLFLTMDPKYGELSRAMRNRGVEVFMEPLPLRATLFDRSILGLEEISELKTDIEQGLSELKVDEVIKSPLVSHIPLNDSYVRSFALLDDIISNSVESMELVNTVLSTLNYSNARDVAKWETLVSHSSEYSADFKILTNHISERIQFLYENGVIEKLEALLASQDKKVDSILETQSNFHQYQSLHLLINNAIRANLTSISPAIGSSEVTLFFEVMSGIIESEKVLKLLEIRATDGKINDLNYMEKSAAFYLGRNIKTPPRLRIYELIKNSKNFIHNCFVTSIEPIFSDPIIYKALYELQSIWKGMFETAAEQNESKLRVFQDLISKWIETYEENEIISQHVSVLAQDIKNFGENLVLTSGFSMNAIWESFRNEYPNSRVSWKNAKLLFDLSVEFDEIAQAQFSDSYDSVVTLRLSIIEFYEELLSGEMNDEEFSQIYDSLTTGIKSLKEVSENFLYKRQNKFSKEFKMLSNFIETSDANYEKLLALSPMANVSTISLFKKPEGKIFYPYPTIFDKLWSTENGRCTSNVDGLFLGRLTESALQKAQNLGFTSGKDLQQTLDDAKVLGKELANSSNEILTDQTNIFKKLLVSWYIQVLLAHIESFAEDDQTIIEEISKEIMLSKEYIISIISITRKSSDESFLRVFEEFFLPSLVTICDIESLESLGKSWILFSCGAIQLYVPSSPYDPAITEHVIFKKFEEQKLSSTKLILSWESARKVLSGDKKLHVETMILEVQNIPERPRVFREPVSIDNLFEEWKAFMESTIDVKPIEELLQSAEDLNETGLLKMDMFQNNSSQFIMRLSKNFVVYSDLNDILRGYVYGLKFGFNLVSIGTKNEAAKFEFDRNWPINVVEISNQDSVSQMFENAKLISKSLSIDSMASEHLMIFFIRLCFAHGEDGNNAIISQALQSLYYRWSLRRMKEEEEKANEGNLFKYSDPQGESEEDFKSLFPDYEDIVDVDVETTKKNESYEEIYYTIAKLYKDKYLLNNSIGIKSLVNSGSDLVEALAAYKDDMKSSQNSASLLSSVISKLSSSFKEFSTSKDEFDFYRGNSPAESKKATAIILGVRSSVLKLLAQWPEHATLQSIATACHEFVLLPMNCPISRLLQKIDQIYTFISEWEKYASSQVTLKVHFDDLTRLIVSWRKLELSTWKSLFINEESVVEKNIGKWWFHLFETIIIPLLNDDEVSTVKLLAALNLFMSQTTYGEYVPRLDLLKAFKNHVFDIEGNCSVYNSLCNLISFYEQYIPLIAENVATTKKKLEKDVSEVILLASWKDVNIDALKQSARRSHNNLYKIVRKYRSLLATPVSSLIELGLSVEYKVLSKLTELPVVTSQVDNADDEALCSTVSTWKDRPKRLQNISMIDKNMKIYVDRVESEKLPSLYTFAKSIVEDMEDLRKETPKEWKKDNKKLIAALRTQKRKLLSDTIKELRRIGLRTTLRADTVKLQATTNLVLSTMKSFNKTLLEGSDPHFFRILDMLPRLRAAVSNVAEDVPPVDAQKGLAAAENLIHSLIVTREPLSKFGGAIPEMESYFKSFERLTNIRNFKSDLAKVTSIDSAKLNLSSIELICSWLPRLADFAIEAVEGISTFSVTGSVDIFYKAKSKLHYFQLTLSSLDRKVFTSETLTFIQQFGDFFDEFAVELIDWKKKSTSISFIADVVLEWVSRVSSKVRLESSTSLLSVKRLEDIEVAFRELSNSIIVVVQKITEIQTEELSEDDDDWLMLTQQKVMKSVKTIHYKRVTQKMNNCLKLVSSVEHDSSTSAVASALASFTLPLVRHYFKLCLTVFDKSRNNYHELARATFILSSSLYNLATKGFCSPEPPTEEKEDDNLHDGTGLGDGDGATNNSKDVEDDEDLSEEAQKPNEENKEKDDGDEEEENDDAVEIEGDMAGDLEEASDQEKDEGEEEEDDADMDEEVDDIDDLDPNAIDERMWDEEAKDDNKEKDSDKMPENSNDNDEMEANEDEKESDDKSKQQEGNKDQDENEDEEKEEEGEDGEDKDVGEQEDEVKNQENEQMDDFVPETETLDLPEDMQLDGDEEEDKGEEDDEKFDDKLDDDLKEDKEGDKEEDKEEEVQEGEENIEGEVDQEMEPEEEEGDDENNADPTGEGENEENNEDVNSDEETVKEEKEKENDEEGGNDNEEKDQETAEGVDGANEDAGDDDVDMETAVKQEAGEKGEGADNQVMEENEDIGATGGAASDPLQQENEEESTNQDDARDMARESLKQLGDSLKEFHRRRQEIKEAAVEEKEETVDQTANERPDEFQHVDGENADFDTQALGAADKDQVQSIDEDKAIDDDMEEAPQPVKEEAEAQEDAMDVDEAAEEVANEDADIDPEADFEGKTKGAFIGERKQVKEENEMIMNTEFNDEDILDEDSIEIDMDLNDELQTPPLDLDDARELWKNSELATQELASGLCEQLRLILEPTLATKLRGDYKTGKRLNMKRIITYIASEFRKDKIWLRRTKPSKRQYQIMIAVDDSKSMSESKSTELAFHSIALVSKALTQLESGGLSIVRFGEDIKVVHPFDKPFNQETGSKIFQWFDFQQTRTDIKQLCDRSFKIFEDARSTSSSDLWQLQIILSDGVCEDHETIQRMVRKAREEKIMLVFVIIDGINSNESILDMSQVSYVNDPRTGAMTLQVDKYLDTFPFEFYVVVRNIDELPEMLSLILRQYFAEVASI